MAWLRDGRVNAASSPRVRLPQPLSLADIRIHGSTYIHLGINCTYHIYLSVYLFIYGQRVSEGSPAPLPSRVGMLKNLPSTVFQSRKLVSTIARTHQVDAATAAAAVTVSISSSRPHTMSADQQQHHQQQQSAPTLPQPPSGTPPPRQPGMAFFPLGYKEAVHQWVRRLSQFTPFSHSLPAC